MLVPDTQLGKFVVAAGLLGPAELSAALSESAKTGLNLEQTLLKQGRVSPDELRGIKAFILGVPVVDLKGQKIPLETLLLIPEPLARQYNLVAYKHHQNQVEVAMLDLESQKHLTGLSTRHQIRFVPRLTDTASLKEALVLYQKGLKDHFGSVIQREAEAVQAAYGEKLATPSEAEMSKLAAETSVGKLVNALLKHAVIQGVSDMYFEPAADHYLVRYRLNGLLYEAMKLSRPAGLASLIRLKTLAKIKPSRSADGRFQALIDGQKVSVRLASWPTYYGEQVIARLLAEGPSGFTLEHLGLHGEALEIVHKFLHEQGSLIVTAGPSGAGKTTTLYTMLDILNRPELNLASVEEPIEHPLPGVSQSNLRSAHGFTMAEGLRTVLRQDPDVVMTSALSSNEEAIISTNAVLGGRRLLTSMVAPSAATALVQLAAWLNSETLRSLSCLVLGQRLVRRISETHKKAYRLSSADLVKLRTKANLDRVLTALKAERIVPAEVTWEQIDFYKAEEEVSGEAFSGKIGLFEVLPVSAATADLCGRSLGSFELENQARTEGMLTMYEDGIFKCVQGLTTLAEVGRVLQ